MEVKEIKNEQPKNAGFWVRFAAIWIDILIIYLFLKSSLIVLELVGVFENFEIIAVLTIIAYLAFFIIGKGRTIGKSLSSHQKHLPGSTGGNLSAIGTGLRSAQCSHHLGRDW